MIEKERLYENYKRLVKYPEWKIFQEHIKEEIRNREIYTVNFLTIDKQVDAQREAWMIEGMNEAATLPDYIISLEESITNKIKTNICGYCGSFIEKIKDFGRNNSPNKGGV